MTEEKVHKETDEQPETKNQQQATNMEVNKHPHHVTHKKKWAEYLLEFLMLFLAVFLGFVAENLREHQVEHQREKQYARQLLADLRADSLFFAERIVSMNGILTKHRVFYRLMTGATTPTDKEVLSGSLPLFYVFDISVTSGTYSQMKASGGLRYVTNQTVTAALQKYYEVLLPRVIRGADYEITYYSNVIGPFVQKHFRAQDLDFVGDSVKNTNPIILNRTSQTDQELLNILEGYGVSHRITQERLTLPATEKLKELIDLLKKDYHLK